MAQTSLPNPIQYHVYQGQSLPIPKPYDYVLAAEGVFKRVYTRHFCADLLVSEGAAIAGLWRYSVSYNHDFMIDPVFCDLFAPKIPGYLLTRVLNHARLAGGGGVVQTPVEQMYHFHFVEGEWRVSIPKQTATGGSVRYYGGHEATIVLDLHSHHEMHAYFSPTDDRDEQGCRFYGVIGRIFTRPEIRLRLGLYGDFVEVAALDLFENLGPFTEV